MKLLDKIENVRDGRLFSLLRDDNVVIGVTADKNKIPQMISEEYCGIEVRIDKVSFIKHDYTYDIEATLFEDGGDENAYDFKLSETVYYK